MPYFGVEDPSRFGWSPHPTVSPFTFHGVPFPGGVAAGTAAYWTRVLGVIVPHIAGGLHGGWCWGYDARNIAHTSDLSFHDYGLALDINAPANPQRSSGGSGHYQMPTDTGDLLHSLGIEWGGLWTVNTPRDPMHIQCMLSPGEMHALMATQVTGGTHYGPWYSQPLGTRVVEPMDSGSDVEELQRILNAWYPSRPALTVDGYYGPLSEAAVRYLQGKAGIAVDGIVGAHTFAALHVKAAL